MIEIYTKAHCAQCVITKREFKQRGIPFKEYEVTDELGRQLKEQYGVMSAPFVKIDEDNYWAGLNVDRIREVANDFEK